MLPVHLTEQNEDGSYQDGLSFDDYSRAHQFGHKLFASRSSNPPSWAVNLRELSLLFARFLECRAGIHCPRIDTPERRIVYAQNKILRNTPMRVAALEKLVAERMASTDEERRHVLEIQIRTLDGQLCVDQRGPALIAGVVWYFFRCGFSAPETSAALKGILSPVGVRQMAHRLEQLWQKMQSGQDKKPKPGEARRARVRAYYHMKYAPIQRAREKAARAAETPEEREARRAYHADYYQKNRARIRAQQKFKRTPDRIKAMNEARRWRETPEKRRARYEKEYAANPEKYRARARAQYLKLTPEQKERRYAYYKKWVAANPDKRFAIELRCFLKRARRVPMAVRMKINVLVPQAGANQTRTILSASSTQP